VVTGVYYTNAMSVRYQRVVATEDWRVLKRQITDELVIAAVADGVELDRERVVQQVMDLANGMPDAISSTGRTSSPDGSSRSTISTASWFIEVATWMSSRRSTRRCNG
jgi:hypothetical protein